MKIFECIKDDENTKIKVFGVTVYSEKLTAWTKQQKILFGLFYIKTELVPDEKTVRVLGFTVLKTKVRGSLEIIKFLIFPIGFLRANKKHLKRFLNSVCEKYDGYDDYYIFLSRSGEFYLLMHHLREWIKNNNSKKPLLIFTAKYHLNIYKMFCPDLPAVYIKKLNVPLISRGVKSTMFKYKGHRCFVPTFEKYFVNVEEGIRSSSHHYYDRLLGQLNVDSAVKQELVISEKVSLKMKTIAEYVLKNNFIFISPETLSNKPMKQKFWDKLCSELQSRGYEVLYSIMYFSNLAPDVNSMFLTFEESIELAKYARAVIGLRSGFLECLSASNVQLHALYTDFPKRDGFKVLKSGKVLSGFGISKLPNTNTDKLFEYDVTPYEENLDDLINDIINKIESGVQQKSGVKNG